EASIEHVRGHPLATNQSRACLPPPGSLDLAATLLTVHCGGGALRYSSVVKKFCLVAFLLASPLLAFGQENVITLDDLARSAEQSAKANLDHAALPVLQSADQATVKQ